MVGDWSVCIFPCLLCAEWNKTWHNCHIKCAPTRLLKSCCDLFPGKTAFRHENTQENKLNCSLTIIHSLTQSVGKLFILHPQPLCAWSCLSLWMCVLQMLNSVTSLSGRSVHYSQYPMLLAIVSAASGYTPFAHRLYWRGYRARIALILKRNSFPPNSLICFLYNLQV